MSNPKMARYSLDISEDEKKRIETCRDDLSWLELSFGAKLRVLLFERLGQVETQATAEK